MVVTAKKVADGKVTEEVVFNTEKHYGPQATNCRDEKMMYGAQWKTQYIRDTSLQPFDVKAESIEIPLLDPAKPEAGSVRTVEVTVDLFYEINKPDNKAKIHSVKKIVTLDR